MSKLQFVLAIYKQFWHNLGEFLLEIDLTGFNINSFIDHKKEN